MEDPGCGLADTAMEPPESASLQAAMEFPVTASFGPMGPLLRQLQSRLKWVDDDKIQLLKDTMGGLCISLMDVSEAKLDAGFTAKWWMKEVRELCYDTEDYLGEVMKQKQSPASARLSTIFRVGSKLEWRPQAQIGKRAQGRSSASRLREICTNTKRRNRKPQPQKIVTSFLELMARAEVLDDVSERFNLAHGAIRPDCAQAGVSRLTPRLHHQLPVLPTPISVHRDAGGSRLVGVEEPVNKLADLLAFDDDNQKQLKVVCILGFPGVGKTTVATTLHHNFRGKFQCRAFVRVTRTPDMIMILTSILKQTKAPQVRSFPDAQDLIDDIREHLQGKRYFIVIDDLWTISAWNIISRAFPDDNCCSRIVTTTGIGDISLACCGYQLTNIFEMCPLSHVQSRELFSRVFGSEDGCSPNFREVLYGIIKKCGGSPLATVCAASLLAWKPNLGFENWDYVQDCLSSVVSTYSTSEGMKEVLNLIYNDLPPDMKTCLLHLGIYPEGYTIGKDDLVKQWVAEGFLNTIEGQDTKKIAGAYFDELVSRGIVQAADTNYNGEVLFCTVHQMVLDFIRDKSIEENFAITVDCFQSAVPLPDKVRRLSVQFGGAKSSKIPGGIIVSQARSLLFCGFFRCVPSITDYGLLRVLILHIWSDEDKTFDLTRIRELFHLTYLNIECNITIKLPAKIRGLQYLGTLEVDARLSAVPSDIVHLKKLLHLRLPSESNLPHGVGRLASLRTLGYFDISGNSVENVMDLGKLTNLQDLQLTCSTLQPLENLENNMQLLGSVLEKLSILQSVTLIHTAHSNVTASSMSISCDSLSCVSHPPALLERIELLPRIFIFPSLPKWFEQLGRLRILKIAVRELWKEGIDILKALPGLTALTLYVQTAPSERIVLDKEGFFVLKYFNFRCSAPRLKFEAGAMPNLLKLKLSFNIARVQQQDTPAISIERLSALEEISTKIGGAGADAESALTATITNHASNPRIIVRLVDWFFHGDASTLTKEKQQIIKDKDQVNAGSASEDPGRCPRYGVSSVCGRHREMEDAVSVRPDFLSDSSSKSHFFGVFDGHGCSHVATTCQDLMHEAVAEEHGKAGSGEEAAAWKEVMERSFARLDERAANWATTRSREEPACRCEQKMASRCDHVGSTAVVAVVSPTQLIVANAGDSRAVLSRAGVPVALSVDHKPDRPDELERIQAAGGHVIYWDGARVLGVLAMSRAIGDRYLKPYVTAEPEVTVTERSDADECLILASDGLWDVVSNEMACDVVRACFRSNGPPEPVEQPNGLPAHAADGTSPSSVKGVSRAESDKACSDAAMLLVKLALARRSSDNVSVVVVDLRRGLCATTQYHGIVDNPTSEGPWAVSRQGRPKWEKLMAA